MSEERVRRQMEKTGDSPFSFEKLDIHMKKEVFVPVQVLNELRRTGLEGLREKILSAWHRPAPKPLASAVP